MGVMMLNTIPDVRTVMLMHKADRKTIALVPTMGALHDGHLSLVEIARNAADIVVVSIYVNPTQFGAGEDLENYPRTLDADRKKLADAGAHYVFTPDDAMMYPPGYASYVTVEGLTGGLCGASRPGHFRGVTTVVAKLFNCVQPDIAVFGEKDYQQLAVIRRMNEDLDFGIEIIGAPIVRESDGLAMSSRNAYLSPKERTQAAVLSESLGRARTMVEDGETTPSALIGAVTDHIGTAPLADIEYVELVDTETLEPVATVSGPALLALAVRFGTTRLIDNTVLRP